MLRVWIKSSDTRIIPKLKEENIEISFLVRGRPADNGEQPIGDAGALYVCLNMQANDVLPDGVQIITEEEGLAVLNAWR